MTKTERQEIGIEKWKINKGRGILNYVTGFGKTTVALKIINKLIKKQGDTASIMVIVPTDLLRDQWNDRIAKEVPFIYHKNIKVDTIQSILLKYNENNAPSFTLGILDEYHLMLTELRGDIINKMFDRFLLGLSATPEDRYDRHNTAIKNLPIVDIITEEEALANNWIREVVTYCIKLKLQDEDYQEYLNISNKIEAGLDLFKGDFSTMFSMTSKLKYSNAHALATKLGWNGRMEYALQMNNIDELNRLGGKAHVENINSKYNPKVLSSVAFETIKLIQQRKQMLYNNPCKKEVVLKLLNKFKDKKTILFSQSVDFIKDLRSNINNRNLVEYHSNIESGNIYLTAKGEQTTIKTSKVFCTKKGTPKKIGGDTIRAIGLNDFLTNRVNLMLSGVAADAGLDVPDIKLGIVSSFTSNPNQYIQRKGRGTRVDGTDDLSVFVYLYFSSTIEEHWLKAAMNKTTSTNIINWVNDPDMVEFSTVRKHSFNLD